MSDIELKSDIEYESVDPSALDHPDVLNLLTYISHGYNPYVKLVSSVQVLYRGQKFDGVIYELDVQCPQNPIHDIKPTERMLSIFGHTDFWMPETFALREDFPLVPHLNLREASFPKSLCLYDRPLEEVRLTWTPSKYLELIREWLKKTALGQLHESDQPLEPFLLSKADYLIVPQDAVEALKEDGNCEVSIIAMNPGGGKPGDNSYRAVMPGDPHFFIDEAPTFNASVFVGKPREHGVINHVPGTLTDLNDLLKEVGINLVDDLREQLKECFLSWTSLGKTVLDKEMKKEGLILLVYLPQTRGGEEDVESYDFWAFLLPLKLMSLGEALGVWEKVIVTDAVKADAKFVKGEGSGLYLPQEEISGFESLGLVSGDVDLDTDFGIQILKPIYDLHRNWAAQLNAEDTRCSDKFVAIGVGAIGSHVIMDLVRQAWGEWTIIDNDVVLPHNLARHCADGYGVGGFKVEHIAHLANSIIEGKQIVTPVVGDVLSPQIRGNDFSDLFRQADIIVDFSASIPVARYLALDVDNKERVVSCFFNPNASDLVVLAEGKERNPSLDCLEMQYYRALYTVSGLADHLPSTVESLRYGNSCRDLSGRLLNENVSILSGIAASSIKKITSKDMHGAHVWSIHEDGSVTYYEISTSSFEELKRGEWIVKLDNFVIEKLLEIRRCSLPRETGGCIIGSYDLQRKIVYVVDVLDAPSDSVERPYMFIRGKNGLKEKVDEIEVRTAGWLQYVGEWHSHPDGCSVDASGDDCKLMDDYLIPLMCAEGVPPVMIIMGQDEYSLHVGGIDE